MKRLVPAVLVLMGAVSVFACGSSDESSGGGGSGGSGATSATGGSSSCVPAMYQSLDTPACASCIESKCPSQYQALCAANCNSGTAGTASMACANAVIAIGECGGPNCPMCVPSGGAGGAG